MIGAVVNIEKESLAVGNLRHNSTVFYSSNYSGELNKDVQDILDAVIEDESFPKSASKEIMLLYLRLLPVYLLNHF